MWGLEHETEAEVRGLSKKYPTLFFPRKTSDGRLANLITVVGGSFMCMRDLLRPRPVRLSLLGSKCVRCCNTCSLHCAQYD
jgi:hypothetical protein